MGKFLPLGLVCTITSLRTLIKAGVRVAALQKEMARRAEPRHTAGLPSELSFARSNANLLLFTARGGNIFGSAGQTLISLHPQGPTVTGR